MLSYAHRGYRSGTSFDERYAFFVTEGAWRVVELATGEDRGGFEGVTKFRANVPMTGDRACVLSDTPSEQKLSFRVVTVPEGETLFAYEMTFPRHHVWLMGTSADGTRGVLQTAAYLTKVGEFLLVDLTCGEVLARSATLPFIRPGGPETFVQGCLDGDARTLTLVSPSDELVELDLLTGSLRETGVRLGGGVRLFALGASLIGATRGKNRAALLLDRASKRLLCDSDALLPGRGGAHRTPVYSAPADRALLTVDAAPRRGATAFDLLLYDGAGALLDGPRALSRPRVRAFWADLARDGSVLLCEQHTDGSVLLSLLGGPRFEERRLATTGKLTKHSLLREGPRRGARCPWVFIEANLTDKPEDGLVTSWVRDPTG